jgi:hypothetical protein
MKVKSLIEQLQKFNENDELVFKAIVESEYGAYFCCYDAILCLNKEGNRVELIVEGLEDNN